MINYIENVTEYQIERKLNNVELTSQGENMHTNKTQYVTKFVSYTCKGIYE